MGTSFPDIMASFTENLGGVVYDGNRVGAEQSKCPTSPGVA